jgi:hypothetical protein
MTIPNVRNPYDPEEEEEVKEEEEGQDTPEITINAATQVRGNGNIVSIAQVDSMRIATLIATMLNGGKMPGPATPIQSRALESEERTKIPKINITMICGATIIGDRNIIGPGLGDVARQMQIAQRNQTLQAQQQQQQKQAHSQYVTPPPILQRDPLHHAQPSIGRNHGLSREQARIPPTSRGSSLHREVAGTMKRSFEDDAEEGAAKRHC